MPSYTFVSVANAIVLRNAQPVFVDIDPLTLNIDPDAVEAACTKRTKAIIVVHYAGVACNMRRLLEIARDRNIALIEDAAHAILATYRDQPLGTIGDLGCLSFHHTKNVCCGEGGALLINRPDMIARAQVIRDKGTNRQAFLDKEVDKYSWVDVGSSFLLGEIPAAFLLGQLEQSHHITARRRAIVSRYVEKFSAYGFNYEFGPLKDTENHANNGHMSYMIAESQEMRNDLIGFMSNRSIEVTFHYVPLHLSKAGKHFGRISGSMAVTERVASRIVRMPIHLGLRNGDLDQIVSAVKEFLDVRQS